MGTHGTDAVRRVIEDSDLEYPVPVDRLVREHALVNVDIDAKGNSIMLGELINQAGVNEFTDEDDVDRKLSPVFERLHSERHTSLLGRIIRTFT
ncbi:MAG TPA: hypothetical protein VKA37_00675 [Halobacteriales archaeon]|nr:hypothetical protein [Halobacteriales archaeon]